jgi:hypothetical protein
MLDPSGTTRRAGDGNLVAVAGDIQVRVEFDPTGGGSVVLPPPAYSGRPSGQPTVISAGFWPHAGQRPSSSSSAS